MNAIIRHPLSLFVVVPLLLIGIGWVYYYQSPLIILPSSVEELNIKIKEDSPTAEKQLAPQLSLVRFDSSGLQYTYRLIDGVQPYSELILCRPGKGLFDLSSYNELQLTVRSRYGKRIPFQMIISDSSKGILRQRPMTYLLDVQPQFKSMTLSLDELNTPRWWYSEHNLIEKEVSKADFSKVQSIVFSNDMFYEDNNGSIRNDEVSISEIRFMKSREPLYYYTGIILVFFSLGALFFFGIIKNKNVSTRVIVPYHPIGFTNRESKEKEDILSYLNTHFSESELSLSEVSSATGIHERKISTLLKKETGQSFKQYLNTLRVNKAKILLENDNFAISDIAFEVGYANVSHFNKVFKTSEGCAPKDYPKRVNPSAKAE